MCIERSRIRASLMYSAARIGVLGLAALGAGCASQQASTSYPGDRLGGPPQRVAVAPKIEIEDDGLPAQIAPRHSRPVADDPREPWSPNYGGGAPTKAQLPHPVKSASATAINTASSWIPPAPAATQFVARRTTGTQLSAIDEDAIIRRAVAEHEMRRRD